MPAATTGASVLAEEREERGKGLMAVHRPARYSEDEQRFSTLLQKRLDELLRGERNGLMLLRKYAKEPGRLGVMSTGGVLGPRGLRLAVVERMIRDALLFLHAGPHGGPTSQRSDGNGALVEMRKFTTKFPHIVIERTDVYDVATEELIHTQWCASRVQNQRAATRINRMLDAANLGIDVARIFF